MSFWRKKKGATMKALTGHWLLGQDFFDSMEDAYKGFTVDQAQHTAFIERRSRSGEERGDLFIREGTTAHILINGVLTPEPDFFFDMFGGGSAVYGDIVAAVQAAEGDPEITRIMLEVESPGGSVAGFFRTAQAIAAASKPVEAQVTNMAASAAFGLISQANIVVAEDPMTMIGSVGVATAMFVNESRIRISSTEAPHKVPDVTTSEGVATVKRELDAVHAEFAAVIALGRGISVAEVNADFGRGAMLVSGDALQAGMIDGISSVAKSERDAGATARHEANSEGADTMTRDELKAKHPEVYALIHGEGLTAGVAQERDRVTAHVTAAKAVGHPELAAEHIISGADYSSQTVQATYNTAGLKRNEAADRADDDEEAAKAAKAAAAAKGAGDTPDAATADANTNAVFDMVEAGIGFGPAHVEA